MKSNINLDSLYTASKTLALRVTADHPESCISGAARIFDACMRAFDCSPQAVSVTFHVHYANIGFGTATIDLNGNLICQLDH